MVGGRLRLPAKTNGQAWFQATISNRSRRELRKYGKVICLGIRASVMVDLFCNDLVSVVLELRLRNMHYCLRIVLMNLNHIQIPSVKCNL